MESLDRPSASWLLSWLAAWRITHLLMYEAGPWGVVTSIRTTAGVLHDEEGNPVGYPDGNVFQCFLCLSIWVSAAVLVLGWLPGVRRLLVPFALSSAAIWAERAYKHGTR